MHRSLQSRIYCALLHLYPRSFRNEYGDELAAVFAARRAGETGLVAGVMTILMAIGGIVPNAAAEHLDILRRDLRYTVRALANAPGFALTAILVVALGVGANTAAFSVADVALLRPLPFPRPHELVKAWETTPGFGRLELVGTSEPLRIWTTEFGGEATAIDRQIHLDGTA